MPLVIAAPQIWAHFVSDENTEDKGFLAHYTFEGKWLDSLLPLLTEALLGNVAIHLVILRIHTVGSTLKEVLKSYTVPATIYIIYKHMLAIELSDLFSASLFPFPGPHLSFCNAVQHSEQLVALGNRDVTGNTSQVLLT